MPQRFQHKVGGNIIHQHERPIVLDKALAIQNIIDTDTLLLLSDQEILLFFESLSIPLTASEYRQALQDQKEEYQRTVRLWEMDTVQIILDELQPTWLLFDPNLGGAVQSVCGEEVGNEASNVLLENTKWAHLFDHAHEIVLDLGNPETIDGIAIRIDAGVNASHQLRGVDVFAAKALSQIDNPDNQMLSGVDFATLDDDNQILFGRTKRARYVKLTNITTDMGGNQLRVKNIKVRVVPKFFKEPE